jgi:hypothetical protein
MKRYGRVTGLAALVFLAALGCSQEGTLVPAAATDGGAGDAASGTDSGGGGTDGGAPEAGHDAASDAAVKPGPGTLQALTVSTGTLRPVFDPDVTDYDVTSLNSLYPLQVTATTTDSAATVTVLGAAAKSGAAMTLTLQPKQDIAVTVQAVGGATRTYTVHYVPSDLPPYSVWTTSTAGTEPLLFSTVSGAVPTGNYLFMVDRAGMPLYYRTFPQQEVENFQQVKVASGTFYTFNVGVFNPGGWTLGADYVLDAKFQDVAQLQLPAYAGHGVLEAEAHDLVLLDKDHYVALSYQQRTRDLSALNPAWSNQALVMDAVVQEVKAGQTLVEWDTQNFPALQTDSVDGNAFGATALSDYLHVNSLDVDPADGNIVVSIRHTNSIVKVSHTTGQILWTLGGKEDMFGLAATQTFSHQHHVRMHPDGSMTVFDNGNNAHPTRALRFVLDETAHTVKQFDVLVSRPAGQPAAAYMGSITPLGASRLMVGWGGWFQTVTAPAATEIVSGNVTWSMQFLQPGYFSYRALPITL